MKVWLARNKNGELNIFEDKPCRYCGYRWINTYDSMELSENDLSLELAAKVTWNSEPIQVEVTVKEV